MNRVSDSTIDFTLVNAVSCSFFQCQGVSNFNKEYVLVAALLQGLAQIYDSNSQIQAMISADSVCGLGAFTTACFNFLLGFT